MRGAQTARPSPAPVPVRVREAVAAAVPRPTEAWTSAVAPPRERPSEVQPRPQPACPEVRDTSGTSPMIPARGSRTVGSSTSVRVPSRSVRVSTPRAAPLRRTGPRTGRNWSTADWQADPVPRPARGRVRRELLELAAALAPLVRRLLVARWTRTEEAWHRLHEVACGPAAIGARELGP